MFFKKIIITATLLPLFTYATQPIPNDIQQATPGMEFTYPKNIFAPRPSLEELRAQSAIRNLSPEQKEAMEKQLKKMREELKKINKERELTTQLYHKTPPSALRNQLQLERVMWSRYFMRYTAMISKATALLGRANAIANAWDAHNLLIDIQTPPQERARRKARELQAIKKEIDAQITELEDALKDATERKDAIIADRDEIPEPPFSTLLNNAWKNIGEINKVLKQLKNESESLGNDITELLLGPIA